MLILSAALLFSALASFTAAIMAWRQRVKPSAQPMAAMGLAAGFWALFYLFEISSGDLHSKLFWSSIKYPALTIVPVALSIFVLRFAGLHTWPGKRLLAILLIIPACTSVLAFTNEGHHLLWTSPELIAHPGYIELSSGHGPWYWVNIIYSYELIFFCSAIAAFLLARTWQAYRRHLLIILVGVGLPLMLSVLNLLGIRPWPGIDLNPIVFGLTAIFLLLITRTIHILNVIPLANTTLVDQIRDGILVLDIDGRIIELNHSAEDILSLSKQSLIGKMASSLDHPAVKMVTFALTGKTTQREIEIKKGEIPYWYDVRISTLRTNNNDLVGHMAIWHNITERKQIERELRHAATHDPMTGLYNRMSFDEEIDRLTPGRRWPVTIIMIDLDNLKKTNDTLGHTAGDELVRQAARILVDSFRQEDLIARIGGDEFAILIPQCDEATADQLVRRLRQAACQYNTTSPQAPLEFSAGYAVAHYRNELPLAVTQADARMYAEKNERKNSQQTSHPTAH